MTARMPNPRGAGEQLREQLVDAAAAMLTQPRGVPAPSLRAVARAVGVSPTAVYLHFDSQSALVRAVLERHVEDLGRAVRDADDDPSQPVVSRMARRARAYVAWGLEHPGAYQLLFESADVLDVGAHSTTGATGTDTTGPHTTGPHTTGPHTTGPHTTGTGLIEEVATALAASSGLGADQALTLATRIWTGLHGIVSLRLHKPHQEWPTTLDDDVRTVVDLHLAHAV